MLIHRIKLVNFRRFGEEEINLNRGLNLFVGPNNCGKTTILEALGLVFNYGERLGGVQLTKSMETGTCSAEVIFTLDRDEWDKALSLVRYELRGNIEFPKLKLDENLLVLSNLKIIGKWEASFSEGRKTSITRRFSIAAEELSKMDASFNPIILSAVQKLSGQNLLALFRSTTYLTTERRTQLQPENIIFFNQLSTMLDDVKYVRNYLFFLKEKSPEQFKDLKNKILSIFDFKDFDVKLNLNTGQVDFSILYRGLPFDISEMGGGTKSFLLLFSHIYLAGVDVAIIDEADENMHPSLVQKLAHFLRKASLDTQFIITSHNETFIRQFELNEIFRVEYLEDIASSKVKKLDTSTDFDSLLELLGVTLSNSEKAESMFAKILVFTEGDSDKRYIEKFAEKIGKLDELKNSKPIFHSLEGKWNLYRYVNPRFIEKILERKLPILLVLDKDEDYSKEIADIEKKIGKERVHYLQKREIESYVINPIAITKCIKKKGEKLIQDDRETINALTDKEVAQKISQYAEDLKLKVIMIRLLKKLLPCRFIYPKEMGEFVESHMGKAKNEIIRDLCADLFQKITIIKPEDLEKTYKEEEEKLDQKWTEDTKLEICPAKDLLSKINKWIVEDFRVSISVEDIIDELETVDKDIVELINKICTPH